MKRSRILLILMTVVMLLAMMVGPAPAQEAETLPLAEHGPYGVGWQLITLVDEIREGMELQTMIWYPAVIPEGEVEDWKLSGLFGATPDTSAAPYPLILSSHATGGSMAEGANLNGHLASYGFVVMAMTHPADGELSANIDRSLDILFVLDQAALGIEGLTDIIDTDIVGVKGYSRGAFTALSVTGARIDPEYFLGWYEEKENNAPKLFGNEWIDPWDDIVAYRAQFEPPLVEGDLWPPFADERIRAVIPGAPCWGHVFGDRGLAAANTPTFLMAGTGDMTCPYDGAVYIYEKLGTDNRYLLSFAENHAFSDLPYLEAPIKHFMTAFFGYYLQGQADYAEYLTADYVENIDRVVWGPVETPKD
jgi:predicted dienelactone hydrolase